MLSMCRIICVCLIVMVIGLCNANAQSFESMMNQIIRGAPGVTNVAVGSGINATVSGTVTVAAGGAVANVPASATGAVSAAALARGAARVAVRAVPWVGTAVAVGMVADWVKDSGIVPCPPPDFFCKPVPADTKPAVVQGGWMDGIGVFGPPGSPKPYASTPDEICAYFATTTRYGGPFPRQVVIRRANAAVCQYRDKSGTWINGEEIWTAGTNPWCETGYHLTIDNLTCIKDSPRLAPATETEITPVIQPKISPSPSALKQQLDAIALANPGVETPIDYRNVPLTVNAPKFAGPETVTSTRTIPNADGTTSTETTKQQLIVTPTVGAGATVASPSTTFPSQTITTITTVNNTTNVTTVTVKNENNPSPPPAPPSALDIPTDYNREATQKQILKSLSGEGMPEADSKTALDPAVADIEAQNKTGMDAVTGITADRVGLVDWFPKIPTAACRNPEVPNPITGAMLSVEICKPVGMFSAFFNGVVAVYCLYGCVAQVTAAIKT